MSPTPPCSWPRTRPRSSPASCCRSTAVRAPRSVDGASCRRRAMELSAFQEQMARCYGERDRARGVDATIAWIAEEVGELARAVRKGSRQEQLLEMGDVLAWLASLAVQLDLSLDEAASRYANGCPKCAASPCACP